MGAQLANTQAHERVRAVAEQALVMGELTVRFHIDKCGSLERARSMARGFQVSFASMRARSRRRSANFATNATVDPRSDYDAIVCSSRPLPDGQGWEIHMTVQTASMDWDIVDKHGQPVAQDAWVDKEWEAAFKNPEVFNRDPRRMRRLLKAAPWLRDALAMYKLKDPDEVLSLDDLEGRASEEAVAAAARLQVAPAPQSTTQSHRFDLGAGTSVTVARTKDLADMSDDEIWGEGQ